MVIGIIMFKSRLMRNDTATWKRLLKSGSKQSSYTTTWTFIWYFKPVSAQNQGIAIEEFGKVFHFTTDYWVDIQNNDILTIDWKEYTVSWVADKKGLKVSYRRAVLYLKNT